MNIFSGNNEKIEEALENVIGRILIEHKLTVSTAESCTGGMLAARLINFPGISEVFLEGAITYSNDAKMKRLGVKAETLEKYGAVSSETAEQMAQGIAGAAGTDIGISTTGIAGPGGGTAEKPVGLVYIGICIYGNVKSFKCNFNGDRQTVRERTVNRVLELLVKELNSLFY